MGMMMMFMMMMMMMMKIIMKISINNKQFYLMASIRRLSPLKLKWKTSKTPHKAFNACRKHDHVN